jgi:hypothetical protein
VPLNYERRSDFENVTDESYDAYEEDEIMLSRLVVESLLSSAFYEKIFIRYGHRKDFKRLPGSCLLIMALETCNASVSHDINGAAQLFADLTLDTYPGENVSDFANESLQLIKIIQGGMHCPSTQALGFFKSSPAHRAKNSIGRFSTSWIMSRPWSISTKCLIHGPFWLTRTIPSMVQLRSSPHCMR